MRIITSNSCRLVVYTTKSDTGYFNQFFNVIQPSSQFRVDACTTQFRNSKFITRQIVRTSVSKSCLLCINNTNNVHDNFLRSVFVDVNSEIRSDFCSRIPIFYNIVYRTSTLNELVQRLFFVLNKFSATNDKFTVSFWPTNSRVNRND